MATGDAPVTGVLIQIKAASLARTEPDARSLMLLRLAARAAADAPASSYPLHVGPAVEVGLTVEDAEDVAVAVAPIVGTAHRLGGRQDPGGARPGQRIGAGRRRVGTGRLSPALGPGTAPLKEGSGGDEGAVAPLPGAGGAKRRSRQERTVEALLHYVGWRVCRDDRPGSEGRKTAACSLSRRLSPAVRRGCGCPSPGERDCPPSAPSTMGCNRDGRLPGRRTDRVPDPRFSGSPQPRPAIEPAQYPAGLAHAGVQRQRLRPGGSAGAGAGDDDG
jgi:hypothetical protein